MFESMVWVADKKNIGYNKNDEIMIWITDIKYCIQQ